MSNISSARNEEKSTYSKNDEISTERSIVTKISLVNNKNEGEKIIINTSKSQNNYNLNNLDLNSKYTKNSLKELLIMLLKIPLKTLEIIAIIILKMTIKKYIFMNKIIKITLVEEKIIIIMLLDLLRKKIILN